MSSDDIGKLPFALQQLSLAATRIKDLGNNSLAAKINTKVLELVNQINM